MAYTYKRTETVQTSQITGTLTDFPALCSRTHNDFRTVGNGGHVQNASGYDLNLFADSGGSPGSMLDMETELYNAATGQVIKWAKVPSILVGTVVHWQYGDSGISTSQDNATGVWSNSYIAVWHGGDGTTLSVASSTGTLSGTNSGDTATAGTISPGAIASSSGAGVTTPTYNYAAHSALTISMVAKRSTWASGSLQNIAFDGNYTGPNNGVAFFIGIQSSGADWVLGDFVLFGAGYQIGYAPRAIAAPGSLSNNSWHHVVGIVGSTSSMYLDGSVLSMRVASTGSIAGNGTGGLVNEVGGAVDELRVSSVARSAAWIAADYNNQSAPTSFWGLGSEQSVGGATSIVRQMMQYGAFVR